jgi:glycosyltransferase involved in cell wall biosynthesis
VTSAHLSPREAVRTPQAGAAPARLPLTCLVLAQNSASIIARCIRSLAFSGDVLVIDGGSRDDTVAIARSCGARVIVNPWPGYAGQRRFALEHVKHEWAFFCDSDEEVSRELASEMIAALETARSTGAARGFRITRRSQFLGRWMDVGPWAHDTPLRLFRAADARVTEASVHEGIHVDGPIAALSSPLFHYTHTTLSESIRRLNLYTTLEARDRVSRRRIHALDLLVSPLGVFLKYYVVKGCWRAGMRGYLLACITAIYKMVLYVKIREIQMRGETGRS